MFASVRVRCDAGILSRNGGDHEIPRRTSKSSDTKSGLENFFETFRRLGRLRRLQNEAHVAILKKNQNLCVRTKQILFYRAVFDRGSNGGIFNYTFFAFLRKRSSKHRHCDERCERFIHSQSML